AVPLFPVYHWPGLAGLAVTAPAPRFTFEEMCASPPLIGDARNYAVASRATVTNPPGQWQLRVQIMHWRGPAAHFGPTATTTLELAGTRLRDCQATAPLASPSITTNDPFRLAAVISVAGQRVIHQYLFAHPSSSTVVELAMWSTLPPLVPWPAVPDPQVLDAMAAPLCDAYLGSCR
ncbi:MAG TPA: ATPase, partial [Mycobacterium sp.]